MYINARLERPRHSPNRYQYHSTQTEATKKTCIPVEESRYFCMEDDLHQFSKTLTSEFSVDTRISSLWTSFKTKSLSSISKHVPSKLTSTRYCQSWCNRTVHLLSRQKHRAFWKATQNSNRKNLPDIRTYRRPARKNARRHTITMPVIWSMTHQTARNYTPSSDIRNATAQAWPRLRKMVPPIMM